MKNYKTNKEMIDNMNDVIDLVRGDKFLVVHRISGMVEIYDDELNKVSERCFSNVNKINANSRIILIRSNGIVDFYNKNLEYEFSKKSPAAVA